MIGPIAACSWTVSGTHTLSVTATNYCTEIGQALDVWVGLAGYRIYVLLVMRDQ
jgi:hypothetical protein